MKQRVVLAIIFLYITALILYFIVFRFNLSDILMKMIFSNVSGYCRYKCLPGVNADVVYAEARDLWSVVPLTLSVLIIRFVLEKYCFTPIGRWLKVSDAKRQPAILNAVLETAYRKSSHSKNVYSLAKQLDMTERQVERWWRLRRSQDKPSTLVKFSQSMWLGTFTFSNFIHGLYVLWDKDWLWNTDKMFEGFDLGITSDIWWYYMISSAFYWSLTITQFWDVRRKDFWQMFVHHIATIVLLSLSWITNFYRIGSVVLLLHEADFFLEFCKAQKMARLPGVTLSFAVFAVSFIVPRLILFPFCVLIKYTVKTFAWKEQVMYVLASMLWLLLVLHIQWTWMIMRILHKILTSKQEPTDIRSSSSESEDIKVLKSTSSKNTE